MQSIAISQAVQKTPHDHLRLCIPITDQRHTGTAFFWCEAIHDGPVIRSTGGLCR
jgi:hypothetical protein